MAGCLAAARDALQEGGSSGGLLERKTDEGVLTAVADVQETTRGGDGDLGCGVYAVEAGICGAEASAGICDEGLGVEAEGGVSAGGVEQELIDVAVEFIDFIEPTAVGMEGEMARAGSGAALVEVWLAEAGGLDVDGEGDDCVRGEVRDEEKTIVR